MNAQSSLFSRWIRRSLVVAAMVAAFELHAQAPALAGNKSGDKKVVPYRINWSDRLAVSVFDEPQLTGGGRRVDASGTIPLPLIDPVPVYGLTIAEAAAAIETAYKEGRILRNPRVTVTIEEYSPRIVNVVGKVKAPQRVELPPEEQWTIKDVITKCGGFDDTAKGTEVRVTRRRPNGQSEIIKLDVQSAILGKDKATTSKDASFVVEPGDDVYVPEKLI